MAIIFDIEELGPQETTLRSVSPAAKPAEPAGSGVALEGAEPSPRHSAPLLQRIQLKGDVLVSLKSAATGPIFPFPAFPAEAEGDAEGVASSALLEPRHAAVKRVEDLVIGSLILLLVSPLLVFIALGIKLTSPGPVLFRQPRGGVNGETFLAWKFRTMEFDDRKELPVQASEGDPRVTALGRFLRRFSLDELPQFFQVLQGSMSIVGPRPHPLWLDEYYGPRIAGYRSRYRVKPGITGCAQVNGFRGPTELDTKMKKRLACDLWYIRNWSLWLDLKIILKTPLTCLRGKNAC